MIPRSLSLTDFSEREVLIHKGWRDSLLLPEINEKLLAIGTEIITEREYISRVKNYEEMAKLARYGR